MDKQTWRLNSLSLTLVFLFTLGFVEQISPKNIKTTKIENNSELKNEIRPAPNYVKKEDFNINI